MARMSIDDMFLRDPRVQRLAKVCGWSKFETQGRLLHVFAVVYDRVDAGADDVVQAVDIDVAGEFDGLSVLLIEHELAEQTRRGVRIRGARERTNYLATRKETGKLGGIKSGESRRKKAKQESKVTFDKTEGRANPSAVPIPSASASASADPSEKNSAPPSAGGAQPGFSGFEAAIERNLGDVGLARARGGKRRPKPSEPSESEQASVRVVLEKLSAQNGVRYSGTAAHTRLIVGRMREGATEQDLRAVIGYCALELEWKGNPAMEKFLRPETLFGPQTIGKYLDPARTWFAKLPAEEPANRNDAEAEPDWMRGDA